MSIRRRLALLGLAAGALALASPVVPALAGGPPAQSVSPGPGGSTGQGVSLCANTDLLLLLLNVNLILGPGQCPPLAGPTPPAAGVPDIHGPLFGGHLRMRRGPAAHQINAPGRPAHKTPGQGSSAQGNSAHGTPTLGIPAPGNTGSTRTLLAPTPLAPTPLGAAPLAAAPLGVAPPGTAQRGAAPLGTTLPGAPLPSARQVRADRNVSQTPPARPTQAQPSAGTAPPAGTTPANTAPPAGNPAGGTPGGPALQPGPVPSPGATGYSATVPFDRTLRIPLQTPRLTLQRTVVLVGVTMVGSTLAGFGVAARRQGQG